MVAQNVSNKTGFKENYWSVYLSGNILAFLQNFLTSSSWSSSLSGSSSDSVGATIGDAEETLPTDKIPRFVFCTLLDTESLLLTLSGVI